MEDIAKVSKFMSLVLRHKPEIIGVGMDPNGWVGVKELLEGINKHKHWGLNFEDIRQVVVSNNKKRFSFDADFSKIRANQGHSISVDVGLKETEPPDILYHGTAERFLDSIKLEGLKPQTRLHVHLTSDIKTALESGRRYGKPVVLEIAADAMGRDGQHFYLSVNGIWLTDYVSELYIKVKT